VAVKELSLEVRTGEFLSLLGPSGCGKTTTLRMIAGFEEPTSGEIFIGGRAVVGIPPYRRPVNMVFQNYALFPHLTVFENVAYGLRRRGMPRGQIGHEVRRALELVGLRGLENRYPQQLSGGQQQRVALARALVNKPRVLLLDEPLGALDLKLRKQMQLELKKLQEDLGITFLYVTHDQEEALTLSDRVGVMSHGQLIQLGTPREIYHSPATRFVADFIGDSNIVACSRDSGGKRRITPGGLPVVISEDNPAANALLIRPEAVRVSREPMRLPNCFPGVVRRVVCLGSCVLAHVAVSAEVMLVARIHDLALGESLKPEESVFVGWEPRDARLLVD
jgi:spermidine/putrescine transport system ATP-binding protein